jgi:hypothetical protein
MARQGLASQLRQVFRSGAVTPALAEGETIDMNLRRSHGELFSGRRALASVGEVAIPLTETPYEAPYNAKAVKNVNIDGQVPVF